MTKADIAEQIHQKIGFTKKESAKKVEAVLSLIKQILGNGEKLKIAGFGSFVVKPKAYRRGKRSQDSESTTTIKARNTLTFKPSKKLILNIKKAS